MTAPGLKQSYQYDALGQLTKIDAKKVNEKLSIAYHYNPSGTLEHKEYSTGLKTTYQYDPLYQVKSIENRTNGQLLSSYNYTYDTVGNRTTEIEKLNNKITTRSFQYDKLNRLTQADYGNNEYEKFTYSSTGNRLKKITQEGTTSYSYDSDNRLLSEQLNGVNTRYSYDQTGRLIMKQKGNVRENYNYDARDLMTSYRKTEGAAINQTSYAYDVMNQRVAKTTAGQQASFTYDGDNILSENGTYLVNNLQVNGYEGSINEFNTTVYVKDPLGSVLGEISHNKISHQAYTAYGEAMSPTWSQAGAPTPEVGQSGIGYTGHYFDKESGLYYARNRYYDPSAGRFTERDLIDEYTPQGLNKYMYAGNNPVNYWDPLGLQTTDWFYQAQFTEHVRDTYSHTWDTDPALLKTFSDHIYDSASDHYNEIGQDAMAINFQFWKVSASFNVGEYFEGHEVADIKQWNQLYAQYSYENSTSSRSGGYTGLTGNRTAVTLGNDAVSQVSDSDLASMPIVAPNVTVVGSMVSAGAMTYKGLTDAQILEKMAEAINTAPGYMKIIIVGTAWLLLGGGDSMQPQYQEDVYNPPMGREKVVPTPREELVEVAVPLPDLGVGEGVSSKAQDKTDKNNNVLIFYKGVKPGTYFDKAENDPEKWGFTSMEEFEGKTAGVWTMNHILAESKSGLVSVTKELEVAKRYATSAGTVYKITIDENDPKNKNIVIRNPEMILKSIGKAKDTRGTLMKDFINKQHGPFNNIEDMKEEAARLTGNDHEYMIIGHIPIYNITKEPIAGK